MPEPETDAAPFRYPEMAAFDEWFEGWFPNHHNDEPEALAEAVWSAAIRWAHHRFDLRRCKCGVYAYVHTEGRGCDEGFRKASRLHLWFLDHDPVHHVRAWLWLRFTTEKMRWRLAERLHRRRPELCWCQMVDAILLQGRGMDYDGGTFGDLCNTPLLSNVQPFRPGRCYCDPTGIVEDTDA